MCPGRGPQAQICMRMPASLFSTVESVECTINLIPIVSTIWNFHPSIALAASHVHFATELFSELRKWRLLDPAPQLILVFNEDRMSTLVSASSRRLYRTCMNLRSRSWFDGLSQWPVLAHTLASSPTGFGFVFAFFALSWSVVSWLRLVHIISPVFGSYLCY
jgi:hypothetical protein